MSTHTDHTLWDAAVRAAAKAELPPVVGGVRLRGLLSWDPLSTTWAGWDTRTGAPVWIRILSPRWHHSPQLVRRLRVSRPPSAARPFVPSSDNALPHAIVTRPGTPIAELVPDEDGAVVSLVERCRALAAGLSGLESLHAQGRGLGDDPARWLTLSPAGAHLIDPDRFPEPSAAPDEVAQLARAVHALDPDAADPIAALVRTWLTTPPPSAADGTVLLKRAMAAHLARLRHTLVRTRRVDSRRDRVARLTRTLRRLARASRPPTGSACLAADGKLFVVVHATPKAVTGGLTDNATDPELPTIWTPEAGLDPVAARMLLRAHSTHLRRPSVAVDTIQDSLPHAIPASVVCRWLAAARRLRSARLLLDAESRLTVVRSG